MPEITTTIDFEIFCECGEGLCKNVTVEKDPRTGNPALTVERCKKCHEEKYNIRWSSQRGYIGKSDCLFSITWDSCRIKGDESDKYYKVVSTLPGIPSFNVGSYEEGKIKAQELLNLWFEKLEII
jgi:NMD protein affecting ribosome stability and mRNA decay